MTTVKITTACHWLIRDLKHASIEIRLSAKGTLVTEPKNLTRRWRARIAANHVELIAYLNTAKKRVSQLKRENSDLLLVMQCDDLTARCFGDGQPREPSTVTMKPFRKPARKAPKQAAGPRAA